jgi:RNA polymerase sigma-70 factor (ECF subfamily)
MSAGGDFPAPRVNGSAGPEYPPSPMECEATRLMTATKHGDAEAFDALVERLRGRAFRVAASLVGSREDALDLSQETFFKVYRARETYREGDPFLPWFHRILRNTCFSFLRRARRLERVSLDDHDADRGPWEIVDPGPPTERPAELSELQAALSEAISELKPSDREILTLRHDDELSYREIAEALAIPEGTVMSRLYHARRRLRDALEGIAPDVEAERMTAAERATLQGRRRGKGANK